MALTSISIEPLYISIESSVSINNDDQNSKECTPGPSPYCDFVDSPQMLNADDTLTASTFKDFDITMTIENAHKTLNINQ